MSENVVKIAENETSRTWLYTGDAAKAVVEAHDAMLLEIEGVNARSQVAAQLVRDEFAARREEVVTRHAAELSELQREANAKLAETFAPFSAEAQRASDDFHGVVYGHAPEMERDRMPMININQYPVNGLVTVVEPR